MKMTTENLQTENVMLFGQEYVAVQPADGFRIAVESAVVKWPVEDALACLGNGNTEKATEMLEDVLREIKVAERLHKVPMLVRCFFPETAPEDQHVTESNGAIHERLKEIRDMLRESMQGDIDGDPLYAAEVLVEACEEIDRLLEPLVAPEDQHGPTGFQL
jgi:hypothetical protein